MNKKQKYFNATTTIIQGLLLLGLGICILVGRQTFLKVFVYVLSILFIGIGTLNGVKNVQKKIHKSIIADLISSVGNILVGIFIYYNPRLFMALFPILFTGYIFIDAIIKITVFYIYKKDHMPNRFAIIIRGSVSFIFFVIMAFYPFIRYTATFVIAGVYFILLASTYILDGIEGMAPTLKVSRLKRKVRVTLPIFIAAFIPRRVLNEVNQIFTPYRPRKNMEILKENITPDIEVLVHFKKGLTGSFGHVDLYYDDKIISYGSYDESRVILSSAIGDGVLFTCDKKSYLNFCNNEVGKTIVGFGLKLTKKQKSDINKKIKEIMDMTYLWDPDSKIKGKGKFKDYASRLYDNTKASFYKFREGKFKTFFVLNTNCVLIADEIIGKCGIDMLKISGLIAPGSYYEYFDREFKRKNSIVVSKKIYINNKK